MVVFELSKPVEKVFAIIPISVDCKRIRCKIASIRRNSVVCECEELPIVAKVIYVPSGSGGKYEVEMCGYKQGGYVCQVKPISI